MFKLSCNNLIIKLFILDHFQTEFYRQIRANKGQVTLLDPLVSNQRPVVPQADIKDVYTRFVFAPSA